MIHEKIAFMQGYGFCSFINHLDNKGLANLSKCNSYNKISIFLSVLVYALIIMYFIQALLSTRDEQYITFKDSTVFYKYRSITNYTVFG